MLFGVNQKSDTLSPKPCYLDRKHFGRGRLKGCTVTLKTDPEPVEHLKLPRPKYQIVFRLWDVVAFLCCAPRLKKIATNGSLDFA